MSKDGANLATSGKLKSAYSTLADSKAFLILFQTEKNKTFGFFVPDDFYEVPAGAKATN